jgi:2-iminobutanoate/2-iminopropanoate deaminase
MVEKKQISTNKAPLAIGPYSQGIQTGNLIFLSGQIPLDPSTGAIVEGDIKAQAHQVLKNVEALCKEVGGDLSNIVKMTVFMTDMNNFAKINEVYSSYFDGVFPARSAVQVAGLPLNSDVEMEAILSI